MTSAPNPSERFSVRRLNLLAGALHASRYLEIGVCEGKTFLGIQSAQRTGVDPLSRPSAISSMRSATAIPAR